MKLLSELAETISHGIPSHYHEELENRLTIAWGDRKRKRFSGKTRTRAEILMTSRQNRARVIYLHVQDKNCLLFLPFILAYSPRACVNVKTSDLPELQEPEPSQVQIYTGTGTKELLDDMARRRGFSKNLNYLRFTQKMFAEGSHLQEPHADIADAIAAEPVGAGIQMNEMEKQNELVGDRQTLEAEVRRSETQQTGRQIKYMFSRAPTNEIPRLGSLLSNAVQASKQWEKEKMKGMPTTECVTTLIPKGEKEDISITLWVGRREGLQVLELFKLQRTWSALPNHL